MSEEELSRVAVGMGTELSVADGAVEGAIGDTVCEGDGEKNDLGIDLTGLRRDDGDNKTEAGCRASAMWGTDVCSRERAALALADAASLS
jgi:hypothetical protein